MRLLAGTALLSALLASAAWAQPAPLMVVYGPDAPTREGDVDHVERLYISLPADCPDRLYLRIFDPEPAGAHDTRYGRSADAHLDPLPALGRRGRLQRRARAGGRRRRRRRRRPPIRPPPPSPAGRVIAERRFDPASPTDDAWVTLAPIAAADGEQIDGRAWFRLDVDRRGRRHGNAFTVEASLSPDRSDPPADVSLFAYEPTIRWREGGDPTEVRFAAPAGARLRLQSFDGAEGEIALVSTFGDERLPASGQDEWRARRASPRRAAPPRSRCAAAPRARTT